METEKRKRTKTIASVALVSTLVLCTMAIPAMASGPDLTVTSVDAYHTGAYHTYLSAWFNLSNEVDVTVSNIGDAIAGVSNVSLYANDEFIGKLPVSSMSAGLSETVQFNWIPVGGDCADGCDPVTYTLKAIADCDSDVDEFIETNNESTTTEDATWNGYAADEPLENIASGRLNGGLMFTTGTGSYTGLYTTGASMSAQYDIALPDSAAVELARLNVYYTWVYPKQTRPEMEVSITNQTGTYILTTDRYYDDRKCWGSWDLYWGNWVYDVTPYIQESGVYSVTVKNVATGSVCPAGPGIVILYRDDTKPLIDYWINEGGDVLEVRNGYLRYSEAITNASFDGSIAGVVANATLGLVNPWANSYPDGSEVFFNGISLGKDVYCGGYGHPLYCSRAMSVVDMETNVGDSSAEVAISLLDVKDHLNDSDNYAGMGDIKDIGALPANAFLVVEYIEVPVSCALSGVGSHPGHLNSGDNLTLTARVKNTGENLVYYQMEWQIKNESGLVVRTINSSVFAEEVGKGPTSTSKLWTADLYAGSYAVVGILHYGATADNLGCTDGPVKGGKFTVIGKPDLTPTTITTSDTIYAYIPTSVIATIENIGMEDAESFDVALYADVALVGTQSVASLAAGASTDLKITWEPSATGDVLLKIVVDYGNDVRESNETNNELTKTVTVTPGQIEWIKTFGGAENDYGNSVQQTSDGGYILTGGADSWYHGHYVRHVYLIKTDSNGAEEWSKTFGGSSSDYGMSVQQTSDGGFIIAGSTNSYGAGSSDAWLIKTDPNGTEEWSKTFGGAGNDYGNSVDQTSDGGYTVVGHTYSYGAGSGDAWLIKTDSNGNEQWNKTFGGGNNDWGRSVQQTSDGGYIITGGTDSWYHGSYVRSDVYLVKTDSSGTQVWQRNFGSGFWDYGNSVQQTSDGGYIITGYWSGNTFLRKTDSTGNAQWTRTFYIDNSNDGPNQGNSVQQTSDGGYIIAEGSSWFGSALRKTDSNGVEQWVKRFGGGSDAFYSVQQTTDGGYITAGSTSSYGGAGGSDVWLAKLSN